MAVRRGWMREVEGRMEVGMMDLNIFGVNRNGRLFGVLFCA